MSKINKSLDLLHSSLFSTEDPVRAAWIGLYKDAPNYKAISNDYFYKLVSKSPFFAVSAIDMTAEELEKTGKIFTGIGCLGGVLYAVPAYKQSKDSFKLHNFGTHVMDFRAADKMNPYLFTLNDLHKVKPVNYLAMGRLFYELHEAHPLLDSQSEVDFQQYSKEILGDFTTLWNNVSNRYEQFISYTEANSSQAVNLIQSVAVASGSFHSLSYFYFEAVSLAIMLYSESEDTTNCASRNELNNSLYIDLVNKYRNLAPSSRFGSYGFQPSFSELVNLLKPLMEYPSDSKLSEIVLGIANGLVFFIGSSLTKRQDLVGMIYYDYCVSRGYQNSIENQVSIEMLRYWEKRGIELVYNGTIEKGEVGITPVVKDGVVINSASYDDSKENIAVGRKVRVKIYSRPIISESNLNG